MEMHDFAFIVDVGRPQDGLLLITLFAITEKYARARAKSIIEMAFPDKQFKQYSRSEMTQWMNDALALVSDPSPIPIPAMKPVKCAKCKGAFIWCECASFEYDHLHCQVCGSIVSPGGVVGLRATGN